MFTWENAFEACFLAAPAPCLTCLGVCVEEEKGVSTWNVLKAAPALVRIEIACASQTSIDAAALQSISTGLVMVLCKILRNGLYRKLWTFFALFTFFGF